MFVTKNDEWMLTFDKWQQTWITSGVINKLPSVAAIAVRD